jgi:hypothetical protein
MKRRMLVLLAAVFLFCPGVFAEIITADDLTKNVKGVSFTFDALARIRYEYLNNNATLGLSNDEHDYFRFKFSGGVLAEFFKTFSFYGRLTTESRTYIYNANGAAEYNINEVVIDNLFVSLPKLLGVLDVKIGRMDLPASEYGEGFLLADGTPLDGSRTFYYNAAKAKFTTPRGSVELIGIYNTEFDDLPVINDQDKRLNDSQESAFIVYGKSQLTQELYIEPYYMWKVEDATKNGNQARFSDQKTSVNTFGSYLKYDLRKIAFRAQAALQLGNYDDEIGRGFGGYAYVDLPLLNIFRPLSVGYVYLSGDDPDTSAVEAWNPMFSRSTVLSEILGSLYSQESGAFYWTNLQLCRIESTFRPLAKMVINASYDFVYANESITNSASALFSDGNSRGNLMRCKVSYNFSTRFSAFILGEYFIPGNFYNKDAQDASFVRAEFMARI